MTENTEPASAGSLPPLEFLRECFSYDPETGKLFWKDRPRSHFKSDGWHRRSKLKIGLEVGSPFFQTTNGKIAGVKTSIMYQGRVVNILVHVIGWMLSNGPVPEGLEIDHRDGDPCNNRLSNLRLATHSQNIANACDYRFKTTKLPRGVYQQKGGRYEARVSKEGNRTTIGYYDTAELAHQAFLERSREIHGEFFKHQKEEGETGG